MLNIQSYEILIKHINKFQSEEEIYLLLDTALINRRYD